jgi:hypothetical protein
MPKWLGVLSPKDSLSLAQLDLGETEAVALATEMHAEVLLMDERVGQQEAVRRGLRVSRCRYEPERDEEKWFHREKVQRLCVPYSLSSALPI